VRSAVMNKGTEWIEWLSLKMHRREGKWNTRERRDG
jgi:hypothetical protein